MAADPTQPVLGSTATDLEEILVDIYSRVLGVDEVGLDVSFFDQGGDSLSALRVIREINSALAADLPVTALLDAPSVRRLSRRLG
nr:phosphopantetheine-binding protein [[Mycobacterium] fortunisiensis]